MRKMKKDSHGEEEEGDNEEVIVAGGDTISLWWN
jgi:hypothetical protein